MPLVNRGAGPGGVADCVAWYKPESLTGANGSGIASWADSSPNALTASQGTAGKRPTVLAPALNGHTGARFDGSDDVLFLDAAVAGPIARNVNGVTIIAVASTATVATGSGRLLSISTGGSAGANRSLLGRSAGLANIGGRRLDGDAFDTNNAVTTLTADRFYVWTGVLRYADAQTSIYLDGAHEATGAFQTAGFTSDTNSVAIGLGAQAGNSLFWNGVIVEMAVFDRILTDAERAAAHSAMQDKFAIIVADYVASGATATADLSSTGALSTGATPAITSTAGLSASGSLSAPATPSMSAAAGLGGSGSLTAAPVPAAAVTASIDGSGSLAAAPSQHLAAPAALSGSASLAASTAPALATTAAAIGIGSLTAATQAATGQAANLAGNGSLTAAPVPAASLVADLASSGSLSAASAPSTTQRGELSGEGLLSALSGGTAQAAADLAGAGSLVAKASPGGAGAADLGGSGTLATTSTPALMQGAILAGSGSLAAAGESSTEAVLAGLSGSVTLAASSAAALVAEANLAGLGSLQAVSAASVGAAAALSGSGTLVALVVPASRDITVHFPTSGRSRELTAIGRSRSLAAAGRSRTLTAVPRE